MLYVTDPTGGVGVGVGVADGNGDGVGVGLIDSTPPAIEEADARALQFTAPDNVHAHTPLLYPLGVQFERDESGQIFVNADDLLTCANTTFHCGQATPDSVLYL